MASTISAAARPFSGATAEFAIAPHWQIMTMTAFGVVPRDSRADEAAPPSEHVPRHRRDIGELLWPGT